MVVILQLQVVQVGLEILCCGGNVIDVVIVIVVVLIVVELIGCGIGGDVFVLVWICGCLYGLDVSGCVLGLFDCEWVCVVGYEWMLLYGWMLVIVLGCLVVWGELLWCFGKLLFE